MKDLKQRIMDREQITRSAKYWVSTVCLFITKTIALLFQKLADLFTNIEIYFTSTQARMRK